MLRVGLTGGIASGKSTVGGMFARRGARVIHADVIAHELMAPGNAVYDNVVQHFGHEILNANGTISRSRLAAIVFPQRIGELNVIVHPAVIAHQDRWMDDVGVQDPAGVAIVEAALIYEAHADTHFDKVVVVTAPIETRIARFAERMKIPIDEAQAEVWRRMAAQLPEEEKVRRADYVIDNSGTRHETEAQVERLWAELARIAAQAKT